ncbi:protoglobin domain-containing protein [Hyphomicrobium zavarzinii]|uniref:protoglobin domain-containing protein n=1 Tax=Hyphomicrobium zavarzinii TaxID=48292 RepID=UPI003B5AFFB7
MTARLSFNQIDEEARRLLRENKEFLSRELPGVLDVFYTHLAKFPETAAFFKTRDLMTGAKNAQLRHWQTILDGNFDGVYEASIKRIGETHHRIGLDPRSVHRRLQRAGKWVVGSDHASHAAGAGEPGSAGLEGQGGACAGQALRSPKCGHQSRDARHGSRDRGLPRSGAARAEHARRRRGFHGDLGGAYGERARRGGRVRRVIGALGHGSDVGRRDGRRAGFGQRAHGGSRGRPVVRFRQGNLAAGCGLDGNRGTCGDDG